MLIFLGGTIMQQRDSARSLPMGVAVVTRTTLLVNRNVIITVGSGQEHVSLHVAAFPNFWILPRIDAITGTLRLEQTLTLSNSGK